MTIGFDPRYLKRDFTSVGTRPIRPDGIDKVTGRARYGADFNMAGQLVGRILQEPSRPRDDQEDRHVEGGEASRREGGDHCGRPARSHRWRFRACTTSWTTAWRARRRSTTAMRWLRSPRSMPARQSRR